MPKRDTSPNGAGVSTPPPTAKSFDREQAVIAKLSARYKELSTLWETAEEKLLKFRIPTDVYIRYHTEDEYHDNRPDQPTGAQLHSYLGFVRCSGGWRICTCTNHDNFPQQDFEWKPVTESRLDIRLAMIPHLTQLREAVVKAAEECLPKLDEALTMLRDSLENW